MTEADERWHRDLFKQVVSAAQLPDFVPYDLRHTFASLLLSGNVPLLYVSKQVGHAKATTTLDHDAKWLPSGEQRFVNLVGYATRETWHQVDIIEKKDSEVVEKFGGPGRCLTYGQMNKILSWLSAAVRWDLQLLDIPGPSGYFPSMPSSHVRLNRPAPAYAGPTFARPTTIWLTC